MFESLFFHAASLWDVALHGNAVSDWLAVYTEWSWFIKSTYPNNVVLSENKQSDSHVRWSISSIVVDVFLSEASNTMGRIPSFHTHMWYEADNMLTGRGQSKCN